MVCLGLSLCSAPVSLVSLDDVQLPSDSHCCTTPGPFHQLFLLLECSFFPSSICWFFLLQKISLGVKSTTQWQTQHTQVLGSNLQHWGGKKKESSCSQCTLCRTLHLYSSHCTLTLTVFFCLHHQTINFTKKQTMVDIIGCLPNNLRHFLPL